MTEPARDEPFWEAAYRDAEASPFGPPSEEVVRLATRLPAGATVLDLGCGDGRNAVVLLEHGARVDAVDRSEPGIRKLRERAREGVRREPDAVGRLNAWVQDLRTFAFHRRYDATIAHGVLHLLPVPSRDRLLAEIQAHTRPGGWNVVAVFTDRIPSPPDLAPHTHGLFAEGALRDRYEGWDIEEWRAYTLQDEHAGGVRHRHAVNRIVARRPR